MTFLSNSSTHNVGCSSCGAALSGEPHHRGLSCDRAGSDGCPVCGDPPLLGTSGTRSDIDPWRGVIVAHSAYIGPSRGQICLLPFRVSPITSSIAWFPSQLVLVGGRELPSGDEAWFQLSPLVDEIEGCRVRISHARTPRAPLVQASLRGTSALVGIDESSWDVITRLPVTGDADVAILADDVPWTELYGRPLAPIDTWWWNRSEGGVQSTLRLAALMAYLLDLGAPSDGLRPIEHLLMSTFEVPELVPHVHPHEDVFHVGS